MVVSDTSPLNYLVLIEQINLLPQLFGRVLIPQSVLEELNAIETPQRVRGWATNLPEWIEVSPSPHVDDVGLTRLHAGERDGSCWRYLFMQAHCSWTNAADGKKLKTVV